MISVWWGMGKSWLKIHVYLWEKSKWPLPFNWHISKRWMSARQSIQFDVSRPKCFLLRRVIWLWIKKISFWDSSHTVLSSVVLTLWLLTVNWIWIRSTFNILIWISWDCIGTANRCRVNIETWLWNGLYALSYASLFTCTGMMHSDQGICISREDFGSGYTLFVYDYVWWFDSPGSFPFVENWVIAFRNQL